MNYLLKVLLVISSIGFGAQVSAQEVQIHGTIEISHAPFEYKNWKMRKLLMQLAREKNNVLKYSLLQPAAVIGSVFFSIATVFYAAAILSGKGNRHSVKDLVKSISNMIELIKAPFNLQYWKNQSCDAIEEINEEFARRELIAALDQ